MIGAFVLGWLVGAVFGASVALAADHVRVHDSPWVWLLLPAILAGAPFLASFVTLITRDLAGRE